MTSIITEPLTISDFLSRPGVIFDVRSPKEFAHAHIPGAVNLPLFSDDERAQVGTTYKEQGRETATLLGLQFAGPKLANLVIEAKRQTSQGAAKVYCARGGMRSASLKWLLEFSGIETFQLDGGYKAFRNWTLSQFSISYPLNVIGGMTGSGKTEILSTLRSLGEQVIDLEAIAKHRGSSFGMHQLDFQPTNEQFENEIALSLDSLDRKRPIWVEDESRRIGTCVIPNPLFDQMNQSQLVLIQTSFEERIERLIGDYGHMPKQLLIEASKRIGKRLGGLRTQEVIHLINEGNLKEAACKLLHYYDSSYHETMSRRLQKMTILDETNMSRVNRAERLRSLTHQSTA